VARPGRTGQRHDITAARTHCRGALHAAAGRGLPTLADKGYAGTRIGIHTPIKGRHLAVDNTSYNMLLTAVWALGERANGAVLYDAATGTVLHARTLDVPLLQQATELVRGALPGCGFAAERVGAHDSATPQFVSAPGYAHAWLNPENTEVSADELTSEPAVKLLVRHSGMTSGDMARALGPLLAGTVDLTYSTNNGLVELSAHGVTKATGLATLAAEHGVDAGEIIAFGDMPNDVPMLRWAGHGVAMGNAHPAAIDVADEVTASHAEDGLAQVLERWWR